MTPVVHYPASKDVVTTPKVVGFLVDNNGVIHDMTSTAADALLDAGVEPLSMRVQTDGTQLPMWKIDEGGERYYVITQTYNDCVFRATKTYMESLGIGTLTDGDKEFFEDHPRVTTEGVDRANVLCVVHGLVVPWGLGITRVYVPKLSTLGDQHREFAKALGMNPKAMTDNNTSNEDFIDMLELEPDSEQAKFIRETYRFEFVAEPPLRPCIVMLGNWNKGKGKDDKPKTGGANVNGKWTTTSYGMGHADFVGPRDALHGEWQIAIEIGKQPEYAIDINKYANIKVAFDKEELAINKDGRTRLSIWSSLIQGKSVTDWQKEVRERAIPIQPTGYTSALVPAEAGRPPINGSAHKSELSIPQATKNQCPECGGPTATVENFEYCLMCNWVIDFLEGICPFCYGDIVNMKCETEGCGYNTINWIESTTFYCQAHNVPLFFRLLDKEHIKEGGNVYCYACPECLYADNTLLGDFYKEGQSHDETMVMQVYTPPKELGTGKENQNA